MRVRTLAWSVGICLSSLIGCEIESTSGPPPRAQPPAYNSPAPGPPPPVAPPPGAPVGSRPAPSAKCAPGSVCFDIVPKAPGAIGPSRLVLYWSAPNDNANIPPEIVPLANLTGAERSLVLPISAVKPPKSTVLMGQAWGYVFAAAASDPSNNPKNAIGVANMMFVHVVGAQQQAPYMKSKFPAGMAEGTAAYRMQKTQGHDNFLLAPPGSVFELAMCTAAQPSCDLPYPNPT